MTNASCESRLDSDGEKEHVSLTVGERVEDQDAIGPKLNAGFGDRLSGSGRDSNAQVMGIVSRGQVWMLPWRCHFEALDWGPKRLDGC